MSINNRNRPSFTTYDSVNATDVYYKKDNIQVLQGLPKRSFGAELLPENVLLYVESGALSAQVSHLIGLQWRHVLLHHYSLLLHGCPLLWQLL